MARSILHHPLDDLDENEIKVTAQVVKSAFPADTAIDFRSSSLYEPERQQIAAFLQCEHAGQAHDSISERPAREARVTYYLKSTYRLHEAIVNIDTKKLVSNVQLEVGVYGNMNPSEMERASEACVSHPLVKKEIERLQLPSSTVIACEPWMYGSATGEDDNKRKFQCYMYMRDPANPKNADGNFYAFPLDFSPVMDAETLNIIKILYLPVTPESWDFTPGGAYQSQGPSEYLPELNTLRSDLKPLYISQPEGTSFSVNNNLVEWQKWRFRVGFNYREGLVLHDLHIDDRSAFHRLALSEMVVPYADPRPPFHRKSAFDFGDAGAGVTANSLALGCDCLGTIKYFHTSLVREDGSAFTKRNVVCLHEQDDLLSWKHTLPNGRADSARSRVLILQKISTLANYEYIFMWIFDQAGGITLEIRATGIVSTQPLQKDCIEYPYGTVVHPGVGAPSHQHIFCMRIDPAVDGFKNQVVQTDVVPMPLNATDNKFGVGFLAEKTKLSASGAYDSDLSRARNWTIVNPEVNNPITRKPVGWKLHPYNSQMLLAHTDCFHWKRAGFADHALFLTKYKRDELYASGNFTNQSQGETGVRGWAARKEYLEGDVVMWHSFGITHIPRVEDFPVMPVAKMHVKLEPANFFLRNPAIDVPPSTQRSSQSVEMPEKGALKL